MRLIKNVLRFVAWTVDVGLLYPRSVKMKPLSLVAAVDADWGGCKETRKSTSGWIIAINGSPIVWRTRKQSMISLSSAESEYVALCDCAKNVLWMRKFYWEMCNKEPWPVKGVKLGPTTVQIDSTAGKAFAENKQVTARNKHIDLKYRFVNLAITSKHMVLEYVASEMNPSDMLTKILDLPTLEHFSDLIRLIKG